MKLENFLLAPWLVKNKEAGRGSEWLYRLHILLASPESFCFHFCLNFRSIIRVEEKMFCTESFASTTIWKFLWSKRIQWFFPCPSWDRISPKNLMKLSCWRFFDKEPISFLYSIFVWIAATLKLPCGLRLEVHSGRLSLVLCWLQRVFSHLLPLFHAVLTFYDTWVSSGGSRLDTLFNNSCS